MKFNTRFEHKKCKGTDCSKEESVTKQCFKEQCDMNAIIARADKGGIVTHVNTSPVQYGDGISGADFTTAMNMVAQANSMFEQLPATVRKRFDNDAAAFLDFMNDSENQDEMIELGLATEKEPEKVTKVEVINENVSRVVEGSASGQVDTGDKGQAPGTGGKEKD